MSFLTPGALRSNRSKAVNPIAASSSSGVVWNLLDTPLHLMGSPWKIRVVGYKYWDGALFWGSLLNMKSFLFIGQSWGGENPKMWKKILVNIWVFPEIGVPPNHPF